METLGKGGVYPLEDKPRAKCRKWQIRVSVGINPRTGKYRQRTKVFHGNWTQANNEKAKFIASLKDMPELPEGHATLEQCCELWSNPANRLEKWSDKTEQTYRYAIKRVCGYLGKKRVDLITKNEVTNVIKEMSETLKPKTISIYMKCIATMYNQFAIEHGYASKNPFYSAPRPRIPKRDVIAFTIEEYNNLIEQIIKLNQRPYTTAALLALCAGLRANECLSEQSKHHLGNKLHIVGTKTETSDAIVPISKTLQNELNEWKEIQRMQMLKYGLRQTKDTYIITRADFAHMEYHELNTWWRENRAKIDMENYRFHDLRHLFVSYCVMKGLPPEVTQKLARHARFSTTMDIYSHLDDSYLTDYVDTL